MKPKRKSAPANARELAFDILLAVESEDAFADRLLGERLPGSDLGTEDRRLATRLVYGTLAWQRRLDWIADRWVRPKSDNLDPEVRCCLRLGLLQIAFLERIPDFAAVDTSVTLAKRRAPRQASGLVNAVLRRALREGIPEPPAGASPEAMGLRWSHPDWLAERWIEEYGPVEAERLLATGAEASPVMLRGRGASREETLEALQRRGIEAEAAAFAPRGIRVSSTPGAGFFAERGPWVPQGEASQLVAAMVGARPGDRVLDACAAPGGKASALADEVAPHGRVTALDRHRSGLRRARSLAGGAPMDFLRGDARRPPLSASKSARFDRVLVDAPCSGTGTLRQHPEIRWRVTPSTVRGLAAQQKAILAGVAPLVAVGGRLLYATCSLLEEENRAVVDEFLERHPGFERSAPEAWDLPESARVFLGDGELETAPHRAGALDGFRVACLRRRG